MYSSIIITNPITCENNKIIYKFSIIFDKINWKTIVGLKINNDDYFAYFSGDFFIDVLSNVSVLLQIPFDFDVKVYEGPEIKIRADDSFTTILWSNITNINCDNHNKPFKIPGLYVNDGQQQIYNNVALYLITLSQNIFAKKINAKK